MKPIITFLLLTSTALATPPTKEEIQKVEADVRAAIEKLDAAKADAVAVADRLKLIAESIETPPPPPPPSPPSINDFELLGSFRLKATSEGLQLMFATIVAKDGKVWISGANTQWAEFIVPETLGATLPTAPVVTMNGTWQNLTPGYVQIPDPKCYGAIEESGKFLYTIQQYYNASSVDRPCIGWGDKGLWQLEGHSQGQAGHIGRIPEPWATRHGFKYFCGLSGTPINGQASWGPSATLFNFDSANPPAADFVIPTKKALFYSSTGKFPSWTHTDEIRGNALWNAKGLYFFGRHGAGETWYGESTSPTGTIDSCSIGTKGYHAADHSSWMWVYNPETLEFVEEGLGPFKALRKNPDVKDCYWMRSAAVDGDKVYVLAQDWKALESGVWTPAIYVFKVK